MTTTHELLTTHPREATFDAGKLAGTIDTLFGCAQSCTSCADACLGEEDVSTVVRCIRLCTDCADVCLATGRVLSRQTETDPQVVRVLLDACVTACAACAEECERHAAHHDHCRVCGEECRRCEEACVDALAAFAA
jgi:hypothetical protein